jgi:hypothetical protein
MKITLKDIQEYGSISAAIEEFAKKSDYVASGVIGPSFATSGPGSGWSRQFDETDYAERALKDEFGASSYIDSEDGREATLDENGDLVWSEESVVDIEIPSFAEILENTDAWNEMNKSLAHYDVKNKELDILRKMVDGVDAAIELINGSIHNDGASVVYYDDNTQKNYIAPTEDLGDLVLLMESDDEDIARDAYSHWCAATSHPEFNQ